MSKQAAVKTRLSNTGSDSQAGFSIGIDWLTFTLDRIESGVEVTDIIRAIETLAGDQIDFSTNRPRIDNHKTWAGTGRSEKGLLLWYNPARRSDDLLLKSLDGNLVSHPGLLPAPHIPVRECDADYIRAQLPEHAELIYADDRQIVYNPGDGTRHTHHGYSIGASEIGSIEKSGELRVSMSARYLDHVDMKALAAYLLTIDEGFGLRCSRIDVALDDHEKQIPLALVEQARRDRNFFNVRSTSVVISDDVISDERGQTIYFGSRQSEAMLRVYDKTVESKGKSIGNRWEVEFHDTKANACLSQWLAGMAFNERTANKLLVDMVLGTVDFRDRSKGDKNRKRCLPLDWFTKMCDLLAAVPVRLRAARPIPSMQRTVDYLKKSVAPSLAAMAKVLGAKFDWFLSEQIKDGDRRMTNQRRKMVADTDAMELCY
jgi:hypothetical protein